MSRPSPFDDEFDAGPAFTGGAGSMAPPPRPGTFDADMARGMSPPSPDFMEGPASPGIGEHHHHGPFSDELFEDMAREHDVPSGSQHAMREPSPPTRSSYYDPAREDAGMPDHLLGQRPGENRSPSFQGAYTSDFRERPSMLSKGFPGDMRPEARDTMPAMHGGSAIEQRFPGRNPTMPEGSVQYMGRDEPERFGTTGGPTRYPEDTIVDDAFIAEREADAEPIYEDTTSPSSGSDSSPGWSV